jgi:hypothetical protein
MKKTLSSVAALFLFGTFAGSSGAFASTRSEGLTGAEFAPRVDPLGISAEERERRVQVCEREYEACRDWCTATKGGRNCYAECGEKLGRCMKKIPYEGEDEN